MTLLPSPLAEALADRYRFDRELGTGGMATVYLAHDVRHGRAVAIKVLRPELAQALGVERFLQEIQIAARLRHPHILPLHDSGEAAGYLFYIMPFVDGETLRAKLQREGSLAIDTALHIAREVADALDHAHRHGVVHRDIKPENILLAEGHAFVADFGIARALNSALQQLTGTGMVLGTPAYMAPEQAMGEAATDGRADLYALGCVLYEMLAGLPPFTGSTLHAIIAQQLTAAPPRVSRVRPDVPASVDHAIHQALAQHADTRQATVSEFAASLDGGVTNTPIIVADEGLLRPERTRFVGRIGERDQLTQRLHEAITGSGSLTLIGGEPGVGKTRLAEHVLREARARGLLVVVGQCTEMQGAAPPFQPIVEVVEAIAASMGDTQLRQALGDAGADLAQMVPVLRRRLTDLPMPAELAPDQQRQLRFWMFRDFLGRVSRMQPLAVLVDDLQWADDGSLLLLEQLAQHVHGMPLLVIGTYRDIELDVQRPFARTLERLLRQRWATRVALKPLPEGDVVELLNGLAGREVPTPLVAAINRETEGNPFFCEEVYRHLVEKDRLWGAHGEWRPAVDLASLEVPEGVRLVVGQRLERLSTASRAALVSAAVIGPRFELPLLEALGDPTGDALLEALEEAERASVIRAEYAGRTPTYRFSHELIRSTLLGALSLPRRQRKHLAIADAMERVSAGRGENTAALAYHLYQAGAAAAPDRTAAQLSMAADEALARGAFDEARDHAEKALLLLPETPGPARAHLLTISATVLQSRGELAEAIGEYDKALAYFVDHGLADRVGPIAEALSWLLAWRAEFARAIAVFERVLPLLHGAGHATYGPLLATFGWVQAVSGDYRRGAESQVEALAAAEDCGDVRAIALVHFWRGGVETHHGMHAASGVSYRKALALAEAVGNRGIISQVLGALTFEAFLGGRLDEAVALGQRHRDVGESIGDPTASWFGDFLNVMSGWWKTGDLQQFMAGATHFREKHSGFGSHGTWLGTLWHELGRFWSGAWEGAPERVLAPGFAPVYYWLGAFLGPAALVSQYVDKGATVPLDRLTPHLPTGEPMVVGNWFLLPNAVESFALAGRRADAAQLYRAVVEAMHIGLAVTYTGLVATSAGIAAACGAQWEVGEGHFATAMRLSADGAFRACRPDVQRWHAWMLAERGRSEDRSRFEELVASAAAGYRALGMPRHVELTERLLARAP